MKLGQQRRCFPIKDPNLIYVGQTVLVPLRTKNMAEGTGTKTEGGKDAVPIDLKVEYTIGKDTPPLVYTLPAPDFTATTEMTGKIAIELLSPDRYNHNLELAFGKDPTQIKSKLKEVYNPAVAALIAKPEMDYVSGRLKIKAPLAAKHDAGIFEIEMQSDTPMHMSGTLKIKPFSGKVMAGSRECKFDAAIELKAEIDWHPIPRKGPGTEKVRKPAPSDRQLVTGSDESNWRQMFQKADDVIANVAIILLGIALAVSGAGRAPLKQTTSMTPLMPGADPNNPGYIIFKDKINA